MASHLFSPFSMRGLTLSNRVTVSPMCQYGAEDGSANDWHLMHLGNLAISGFGLVIAEATGETRCSKIGRYGCATINCDGGANGLACCVWIVGFNGNPGKPKPVIGRRRRGCAILEIGKQVVPRFLLFQCVGEVTRDVHIGRAERRGNLKCSAGSGEISSFKGGMAKGSLRFPVRLVSVCKFAVPFHGGGPIIDRYGKLAFLPQGGSRNTVGACSQGSPE
ncbi:MAG: hypothetical protein HOO04_01245 [Phycisphaerae bacterium]|nr:hypothetical protein [Phycisphaerae bacterium]